MRPRIGFGLVLVLVGAVAWFALRPDAALEPGAVGAGPSAAALNPNRVEPAPLVAGEPAAPVRRSSAASEPSIPANGSHETPARPATLEQEADPRDHDYPPNGGLAESIASIPGGVEAYARTYEKLTDEDRRDRILAIEAALAEYVYGEPKDPSGFDKYQDLKSEAEWLRSNAPR